MISRVGVSHRRPLARLLVNAMIVLLLTPIDAIHCADKVLVEGAAAVQSSRMGTFTKTADTTPDGRAVYKNGYQYLYFWDAYERWFIGADYTSAFAGIRSTSDDSQYCPYDASGWYAWVSPLWVGSPTYNITVVDETLHTPPTCASALTVSGAETVQSSKMGRYMRLSVQHDGRWVFQNEDLELLYFRAISARTRALRASAGLPLHTPLTIPRLWRARPRCTLAGLADWP